LDRLAAVPRPRLWSQFWSHSFPVTAVRGRPSADCPRWSATLADGGEPWCAVLESVWGQPFRGFNPTSTATDQARCVTLGGSARPIGGAFVSVFGHGTAVAPGQGQVSLRRIVPLAVILLRRPTACAPRCHKDCVAPRLLPGAGRMEREPAGPSVTCGSASSRRPSAAVRRRRSGSILAVSVVPRRRKAPHRYA
jgi:hypothetical protein